VQKSFEARDMQIQEFKADIEAYNAETKRIAAVQAGMSEQQIQDIAMGVVAAAMQSNDLVIEHEAREMPEMTEQPMMPPQGVPQ
jgi:uncharacterized protein (DUF885 family)